MNKDDLPSYLRTFDYEPASDKPEGNIETFFKAAPWFLMGIMVGMIIMILILKGGL